ncbi:MAG: hypothetical protein CMK72_01220 [Pseudomonadaceae bacterium]|nr:hypothetical protein [Pseudomonadaceae bacterium]HCP54556.1 hypothetical protein [Pseudomonas sp.]
MSEVKRFAMFGQHLEESGGQFVYASDYDKQAQEIERLRSIISDCAKSCGATVSVECSLDFMAHLPVEIAVVISNLREERDSQQRVCIAAMTELAQLKSRQSGVVLPEREQYTKYLAGVIPVNAVEAGAYKDGWNACLDEVARLNPSRGVPHSWAKMDASIVVEHIRQTSVFDADMIGAMLDYAISSAPPPIPATQVLVERGDLERIGNLASVFDDGADGADAESARGVVHIVRAILSSKGDV